LFQLKSVRGLNISYRFENSNDITSQINIYEYFLKHDVQSTDRLLPVCSPATFVNAMASRHFTLALKQADNNFRKLQWCNRT